MIDASADAVLFVVVPVLLVIYLGVQVIAIGVELRRRRRDRFQQRTPQLRSWRQ